MKIKFFDLLCYKTNFVIKSHFAFNEGKEESLCLLIILSVETS